jgi:hypothetical protein
VSGERLEHHVTQMDATMVECNSNPHGWTVSDRQSTPPGS